MYKIAACPSQEARLEGELYLPLESYQRLSIIIKVHGFGISDDEARH